MKVKAIVSVLVLVSANMFGQSNMLQVEQITTKDGLPQNAVQSIVKDNNGFMWFSSFSSICRFDGYDFVQYYPEPDNPNSLVSRGIYNVVLDSVGHVWIGFFTQGIYCKYNYPGDDFSRVVADSLPAGISRNINRVGQSLFRSESDVGFTLYFDQGQLVKSFSNTGRKIYYCLDYTGTDSLERDVITCMYYDDMGILWVGTENHGIYKININTKPFYAYNRGNESCNLPINDIVRAIFDDSTGTLWLGTMSNGIIKFDKKKPYCHIHAT